MGPATKETDRFDAQPRADDGAFVDQKAAPGSLADGLDVALQPIFEADGGSFFALEALTRGWDASRFPDPHALFDAAEAEGSLEDLEAAQIERALNRVRSFERYSPVRLFVNIDTRILARRTTFFDRLADRLAALKRPQQLIVLELSERHDKTVEGLVQEQIRRLSEQGFKIALDDYGSGVSDFRALHAFSVDFIKIDRYFVDGAAEDQKKRFLLGRMIEMAHLLGQKVICEGVERVADFKLCRDLGSDLVQGYLLGRPSTEMDRIPRGFPIPIEFRRRRSAAGAADSIQKEMLRIEPIHFSRPVIEVFNRFADPSHPTMAPIVGDNHEPLGVVRERDLRQYLHSPYGLDLARNPNSVLTIAQLMRRYPLATLETDPDRMSELLSETQAEGLLITAGVRYVGFLTAESLVRLSGVKRLALAADANPLTRMPGNRVADAFLGSVIEEPQGARALCYFDFNDFKPFNDAYGFRSGDRAILLFSDILKKEFDASKWTCCHIGGDDFFAGALSKERETALERVRTAVTRFKREVESLYAPEDRIAGGVRATGRDGVERRYPLLTCSAGVVAIPAGVAIPDAELLARCIGEVKRLSKRSNADLAVIELTEAELRRDREAAPPNAAFA